MLYMDRYVSDGMPWVHMEDSGYARECTGRHVLIDKGPLRARKIWTWDLGSLKGTIVFHPMPFYLWHVNTVT